MTSPLLLGGNSRASEVLDEAESTVTQSSITTVVDLTGLSVTFTVTDRPVYVWGWLARVAVDNFTGMAATARITDEANVTKAFGLLDFARANGIGSILVGFEKITTPGTYTRKLRLERTAGAGTITNNLNAATIVSRLVATEQPPLAA